MRGHAVVSTDNSTVIIVIKGTSKDRLNYNLLFPCCVRWSYLVHCMLMLRRRLQELLALIDEIEDASEPVSRRRNSTGSGAFSLDRAFIQCLYVFFMYYNV